MTPTRLQGISAIARHELRVALALPSGWGVTALVWALAGWFWVAQLRQYAVLSLDELENPFSALEMTPSEHLVAPWLANLSVVLLAVVPALTYRLLADESRRHTLDLLLGSPVGAGEIVVGKFVGAQLHLGLVLLGTAWMPLSLAWWGVADLGATAVAYLGLWLYAGTLLALGLCASAATSSPPVAALLAFCASMALWVAGFVDPDPTAIITQASLGGHLPDLLRGVVRRSDVAYHALATGWLLLASALLVEGHRDR
jgi:ABC-2 type transport system permease protein